MITFSNMNGIRSTTSRKNYNISNINQIGQNDAREASRQSKLSTQNILNLFNKAFPQGLTDVDVSVANPMGKTSAALAQKFLSIANQQLQTAVYDKLANTPVSQRNTTKNRQHIHCHIEAINHLKSAMKDFDNYNVANCNGVRMIKRDQCLTLNHVDIIAKQLKNAASSLPYGDARETLGLLSHRFSTVLIQMKAENNQPDINKIKKPLDKPEEGISKPISTTLSVGKGIKFAKNAAQAHLDMPITYNSGMYRDE